MDTWRRKILRYVEEQLWMLMISQPDQRFQNDIDSDLNQYQHTLNHGIGINDGASCGEYTYLAPRIPCPGYQTPIRHLESNPLTNEDLAGINTNNRTPAIILQIFSGDQSPGSVPTSPVSRDRGRLDFAIENFQLIIHGVFRDDSKPQKSNIVRFCDDSNEEYPWLGNGDDWANKKRTCMRIQNLRNQSYRDIVLGITKVENINNLLPSSPIDLGGPTTLTVTVAPNSMATVASGNEQVRITTQNPLIIRITGTNAGGTTISDDLTYDSYSTISQDTSRQFNTIISVASTKEIRGVINIDIMGDTESPATIMPGNDIPRWHRTMNEQAIDFVDDVQKLLNVANLQGINVDTLIGAGEPVDPEDFTNLAANDAFISRAWFGNWGLLKTAQNSPVNTVSIPLIMEVRYPIIPVEPRMMGTD